MFYLLLSSFAAFSVHLVKSTEIISITATTLIVSIWDIYNVRALSLGYTEFDDDYDGSMPDHRSTRDRHQ